MSLDVHAREHGVAAEHLRRGGVQIEHIDPRARARLPRRIFRICRREIPPIGFLLHGGSINPSVLPSFHQLSHDVGVVIELHPQNHGHLLAVFS